MKRQHYSDEWRDRAACAGYSFATADDPWFTSTRRGLRTTREPSKYSHGLRVAMAFCGACPVRRECLAYALTYETDHPNEQSFGIYGGLTPHQRDDLTHSHRRAS